MFVVVVNVALRCDFGCVCGVVWDFVNLGVFGLFSADLLYFMVFGEFTWCLDWYNTVFGCFVLYNRFGLSVGFREFCGILEFWWDL